MTYSGRVESVYLSRAGGEVTADASSGDQIIAVGFPIDFDELGGNLQHEPTGNVYAYSAVDIIGETITLTSVLLSGDSFTAGDMLYLYPLSTDSRAVIILADSDDDAPVDATITHSLRPLLPEGVRDPGLGETVIIDIVDGDWVVTGVSGQVPVMDGSVIDPSTLSARTLGGITTTISGTEPADGVAGDIWIDSANGFQLNQFDGTSWNPVTFVGSDVLAPGSVSLTEVGSSVTARALGGVATTIAGSAPSSPVTGDLWVDSANGFQLNRWSGTAWVAIAWTATDVIAAGSISATLLDGSITARALGGITTTIAASAPSSPSTGDIWLDSTHGFQINRWSGTAFVPVQWTATNVITAGSINASLITAATITGSLIAAGTITAGNIAANTITATQIAAGTITAAQIAAGTITGTQIAATTITAANIAANTITASQIAANTITAAQILAATITGSQIAAGTITAANIAANTITASQILSGTITATQIAAGTITAAKLASAIVVAGIVNGTTITGAQFIANGTSGQVLVYSGTPATGNLVASVSGAAGTDTHSNAYKAGVCVYGTSGGQTLFSEMTAGTLQVFNSLSSTPGVISAPTSTGGCLEFDSPVESGTDAGATLALFSKNAIAESTPYAILNASMVVGNPAGTPSSGATLEVKGTASVSGRMVATGGTAASPTLISTDSLHTLGALGQAGISVAVQSYTLLPDGNIMLSIKGSSTNTTAKAAGSSAFPNTLPAGYRPLTTTWLGGFDAQQQVWGLEIGTGGVVTLFWPALSTTNRSFSVQGIIDQQ